MVQLLPQGKINVGSGAASRLYYFSEPYCIVTWRIQGLVPLPEFFFKFLLLQCRAVNKSYLSMWLGLSWLEGSDQMGRSQTGSKLGEGRWDKTGQSSDRPEAEQVNKLSIKKPHKGKTVL